MSSNKCALITGISGQDGSYLAEFLLGKGYRVVGLTRDPAATFSQNIKHLEGKIELKYCSYEQAQLADLIAQTKPSELYNCAGQTYVAKSWEMVDETWRASALLPVHILEALVKVDRRIRFFQASSVEVYSNVGPDVTIQEKTPIMPGTPYGCSKAFAQNMLAAYRKNYELFAVSGILFHHESPRRPESFVSRKVVKAAVELKLGKQKKLKLGNLKVKRDWGYAPDFVRGMHASLQTANPKDYIFCTEAVHSLEHMVETVFRAVDLNYKDHIDIDQSLFRPHEPSVMKGSCQLAKEVLDWKPSRSFEQMLTSMVNVEMKLQTGEQKDYQNENPF